MVHATLMLITPLLRAKIVDALPHELGLLLKTLPSPFEVFGEFSVKGVFSRMSVWLPIKHLDSSLADLLIKVKQAKVTGFLIYSSDFRL